MNDRSLSDHLSRLSSSALERFSSGKRSKTHQEIICASSVIRRVYQVLPIARLLVTSPNSPLPVKLFIPLSRRHPSPLAWTYNFLSNGRVFPREKRRGAQTISIPRYRSTETASSRALRTAAKMPEDSKEGDRANEGDVDVVVRESVLPGEEI